MKLISKESDRLNKILANLGLYSRREADKIIEAGKVFVNNKKAILGQKVEIGDEINIKEIERDNKYFLYYKKVGETTDKKKFISDTKKEYTLSPLGRLDKESEGLILYSNDNIFIDKILSPKNKTEKEYIVKTKENIRNGIPSILLRGVQTDIESYNGVVKAELNKNDNKIIKITLTEGKKHEIRRMLNALNLTIINLKRTRIDKWKIGKLLPGKYIEIPTDQINSQIK